MARAVSVAAALAKAVPLLEGKYILFHSYFFKDNSYYPGIKYCYKNPLNVSLKFLIFLC